ncbi:MAG: phosphoribosylformylglycinamidine synthase subunit PurL, partial [Planctomycetota bacterium]
DADRDPTDVELETLAQTWSEHCVHKTLKSKVRYTEAPNAAPAIADFANHPNHTVNEDGSLNIDNLLKSTIAAATHELIEEGLDWCISIFVDNAGIIRFDDTHAVTFKVETHNHPSALEPYGGAATGIGGCIRDTMGTGLVAKPIASTDIFAVGDPNFPTEDLPKGVLHPRRILKQVVAGIGEYGNRMGIPTVNGLVSFDNRYLGNPLVFAGSVGLIPNDRCFGDARPGDRIVALGGRTGRDGIHGATFSSAELTDSHADEFSHAVQIGNAITEKKCLDVILQARDHAEGPLFTCMTDCGAGGFSSAVGEMGEKIGANVRLENAPLKYDGLSYTEIWISEAQERMVMAVAPENVAKLQALCDAEDVELSDLGEFGTENAELILNYHGHEVGRLSMDFMHNGIPQPTREATWAPTGAAPQTLGGAVGDTMSVEQADNIPRLLITLLSHPNIASKHWLIRLYDHEVQGGSVVKPLTGAQDDGPSDAGVVRPKLDSDQAIALSCGLATAMGDVDPYWMTLAAIDEAVRNAVCVGARPDRIAILDNFCWPGCDKPENLGSLVRASEACYHGAKAYKTPFISGKDSLNNQFTTDDGRVIEIPPTLLISAVGIVDDANKCVTMDAKTPGNLLVQVGVTTNQLGGSHLHLVTGQHSTDLPRVDLKTAPAQLAAVAQLIADGLVRSAHDCSEGGLLVAASEMAFAGRLGLDIDLAGVPRDGELTELAACYAENPTRILLEVTPDHFDAVARALAARSVPFGQVGVFNDTARLTVRSEARGQFVDHAVQSLRDAWIKPLDW